MNQPDSTPTRRPFESNRKDGSTNTSNSINSNSNSINSVSGLNGANNTNNNSNNTNNNNNSNNKNGKSNLLSNARDHHKGFHNSESTSENERESSQEASNEQELSMSYTTISAPKANRKMPISYSTKSIPEYQVPQQLQSDLLFQSSLNGQSERLKVQNRQTNGDLGMQSSSLTTNQNDYDQFMKNVNLLPIYRMDLNKQREKRGFKPKQPLSPMNKRQSLPTQISPTTLKLSNMTPGVVTSLNNSPPKQYMTIDQQFFNQQTSYMDNTDKEVDRDNGMLPTIQDIPDFNSMPTMIGSPNNETLNQKHQRNELGILDGSPNKRDFRVANFDNVGGFNSADNNSSLTGLVKDISTTIEVMRKTLQQQQDKINQLEQRLSREINSHRGSGLETAYEVIPAFRNDVGDLPELQNVYVLLSLPIQQLRRIANAYGLKLSDDRKELIFGIADFIGCRNIKNFWDEYTRQIMH